MPAAGVRELVESLVAAELGHRVLRIEPLQESERGLVLRVEVHGRPAGVVLTLTGPDADHERTAAATALAASAGVPVPAVLAVGNAGEFGYLVREHVPGTEWSHVRPRLDDERVRAVHRQLAEVLLALRGVPLDSFGTLDAAGRPVGMPLVEALHRRAEERVADDESRALLHEILDRDAECFDGVRPGLVHDDLHHGNVVLAESGGSWRITGVLDWEKGWAGSAESDVARMAFWDGMTGPGFWEVYRAAVPEDDGFAHRALLHQLAWCLEYPVRTARHDRDTAAVCAALGVAPPSRFRGR